ncbi:MAG: PLP-dependent aminotransferase family protein, partial [Myxococcales bacterium]
LIYLVTEFQNPKGTSIARDRRAAIVKLAQQYEVPVLEDDPYGELRFRGEMPPPLAALDDCDNVIYLGTFSKTLAPGMRIGWMAGPRDVIRTATIAKQAADLHTGTLVQRAAAALLETFDYDAHLNRLRRAYGERRDAMVRGLEQHMPKGTRWTDPEGGLFLWMTLPEGLTDDALFRRAVELKVAVVPGSSFFIGHGERRFVRLNFSNQTVARIEEGVARLGHALRSL